jgi:hypothetical protein
MTPKASVNGVGADEPLKCKEDKNRVVLALWSLRRREDKSHVSGSVTTSPPLGVRNAGRLVI